MFIHVKIKDSVISNTKLNLISMKILAYIYTNILTTCSTKKCFNFKCSKSSFQIRYLVITEENSKT